MSRLCSPSSPCPRYAGHKYLRRKSIFHISYGKIPEGNFNVIVFYKANFLLGHFHVGSKMLHFLYFYIIATGIPDEYNLGRFCDD